eukprot:CAMPEP_0113494682 /NCGR_PEP_ID=MMETSP0014_2-20120614/29230_1 /TAXON_ID=2857 /ORGANISM="Nitzschia sp." /LENGTH=518 /DNA_ID=CAMNT_0000388577 /DNA_START=343 /DNA_END=1899 /DNA_ORIENTATION=- /assembly_acc=CAM_ASM_000159
MNIAPPSDDVETSQAPFMGANASSSGDLPDRMVGSGGGKRPGDASGDLKKAPPGKSSSSSRSKSDSGSVDLKKPAASKKKLKDPLDDEKDEEELKDPLDEDLDEGNDDDGVDGEEEEDKSSSALVKAEPSAAASASIGGDEKSATTTPKKRRTRKKWKKPKDKPTRPLSAYNLFFRKERASMLGDAAPPSLEKGQKRVHRKTHGKIGFADMARIIGAKWKELAAEDKKEFEDVASKEKARYSKELSEWKENEKKKAAEAKKKKAAAKSHAKFMSANIPGDESARDAMMLRQQQEEQFMRMQMINNMPGGFNPFAASMGSSHRPTPTMDYLRAMQDDRRMMGSSLGPMGAVGSSGDVGASGRGGSSGQYPNASENTASALLNQFGGPGGGPMDMSGRSVSDLDRLQQYQMARMQSMQMMNASMMGGPMGFMGSPMSGSMPGAMGFGSSHMGGAGASSSQQQQQLEQLHQMRMMNQLQGGGGGGGGPGSAGESMDSSLRRMQNRFPGGPGGPGGPNSGDM